MSTGTNWNQAQDAGRIGQAFLRILRGRQNFPMPAALLECMPARTPQPSLPPPRSNAMSAELRAKVNAIVHRAQPPHTKRSADDLLALLQQHIGAANGVSCAELARQLDVPMRQVRHLVTELLFERHITVGGTPSTGYYICATPDECESTAAHHRHRALHELKKAAILTGKPLQEIAGQMLLNT